MNLKIIHEGTAGIFAYYAHRRHGACGHGRGRVGRFDLRIGRAHERSVSDGIGAEMTPFIAGVGLVPKLVCDALPAQPAAHARSQRTSEPAEVPSVCRWAGIVGRARRVASPGWCAADPDKDVDIGITGRVCNIVNVICPVKPAVAARRWLLIAPIDAIFHPPKAHISYLGVIAEKRHVEAVLKPRHVWLRGRHCLWERLLRSCSGRKDGPAGRRAESYEKRVCSKSKQHAATILRLLLASCCIVVSGLEVMWRALDTKELAKMGRAGRQHVVGNVPSV